jgi:hypothetical protein
VASASSSTRSKPPIPAYAAFVARLRPLARQYRFDAMTDLLKKALDEPHRLNLPEPDPAEPDAPTVPAGPTWCWSSTTCPTTSRC